ncbi:SDR family NAD(P)-dependent oxidoreductase [Leptospira wolffii]|uniref:SDR family NAD(P)-dependent oxidoreductase n=1 Tax=Leptospira wolffii TaxID=409998 RepID=UPI0002F7741D|nr:SDR family NAD(P)-dependent oxidoreductase [Leptospira wolffii]EPG65727.1 KR domain protein [Leptospira wolffii serovar Khorat str. Khorat-H2]
MSSSKGYILVTGAGSGIGLALSERLLREGYKVLGSAIHQEEANQLEVKLGGFFKPIILDVRNEKSVLDAVKTASIILGKDPLQAIINVAGIVQNGPLCDLSSDEFKNILEVNVVGTHNISRAFLSLITNSKSPRIINISSTAGQRTLPFNGAYSSSKFAVEALSSIMRMEYHCLGIKVIVVAPSMIKTPMTTKIQNDLKKEPSIKIFRQPMLNFLKKAEESFQNGPPMDLVINIILKALKKRNPNPRYVIYQSWLRDYLLTKVLPVNVRESLVRKVLGL